MQAQAMQIFPCAFLGHISQGFLLYLDYFEQF